MSSTWLLLLLGIVGISITVLSETIRPNNDASASSVPTDTDEELPVHLQRVFHVLGQHLAVLPALALSLTSKEVGACMGDVEDRALYHHVFISSVTDPDMYGQLRRLCRRLDRSPTLTALLNAVTDAQLVRCIDHLPKMDMQPHFDFIQELGTVTAFCGSFSSLYATLKFGRHRVYHLDLAACRSVLQGDEHPPKAVLREELTRALPDDVPDVVRHGIADRVSALPNSIVKIFIENDAFDLLLRPDILSGLMRFGGWRLELPDLLRHRRVPENDLLDVFPLLDTFWTDDGQCGLCSFLWTVTCRLKRDSASRPESIWRLTPVMDHVQSLLRRRPLGVRDFNIYGLLIKTGFPFVSELLTSPCSDDGTGDTHLHRICKQDRLDLITDLLSPSPGQFYPLSLDLSVRNAAGRVPFQYVSASTLSQLEIASQEFATRVRGSFPPSCHGLLRVYRERSHVGQKGADIWTGAVVPALPGIDQVARQQRCPQLDELSPEAKTFVDHAAETLRFRRHGSVWTSTEFETGDGLRVSLPNGNTVLHYLSADAVLLRFLGAGISDGFVNVLVEADPGAFIAAVRRILLHDDCPDSIYKICLSLHRLFHCADRIPSLSRPAPLSEVERRQLPPSSSSSSSVTEVKDSATVAADDPGDGRPPPPITMIGTMHHAGPIL